MRLALARGISHAEFLRTTSAHEVGEYRALNLIDPLFDGDRIDAAAATVANVTFNMLKSTETDATTAAKWLPDYEARFKPPEAAKQTDQEIEAALDRWLGT